MKIQTCRSSSNGYKMPGRSYLSSPTVHSILCELITLSNSPCPCISSPCPYMSSSAHVCPPSCTPLRPWESMMDPRTKLISRAPEVHSSSLSAIFFVSTQNYFILLKNIQKRRHVSTRWCGLAQLLRRCNRSSSKAEIFHWNITTDADLWRDQRNPPMG